MAFQSNGSCKLDKRIIESTNQPTNNLKQRSDEKRGSG